MRRTIKPISIRTEVDMQDRKKEIDEAIEAGRKTLQALDEAAEKLG